jgi:hypothetical protein
MSTNLQGQATVRLKNVSLGDFDPLGVIARKTGWGSLEAPRGEALRASAATLRVRGRHVFLESSQLDLAGAKLTLAGSYSFDGTLDLDAEADLRHVKRRWLSADETVTPLGSLRLAGPIGQLTVATDTEVSRAIR